MKKRLLPDIVIFALLLGALAAVPGQMSRASAILPARTGSTPPAVLPDPADWPMYGHDYQRTNYNPAETTINAGNVNQLVQRWQMLVGSNGTGSSAAPSVSGGVVYVGSSAPSPSDNFFAFDAVSGSTIWHENIGYRSSCFNVGIGSTPAISGTLVVVGEDNAASIPAYNGINAIDGTKIWTNTMSVGASGFPWESPFIFNGRAYLGISSRCDNPSVRGELRAVDMNTGTTVGSAYFVNAGGAGGGIWHSPALSPDGSTIAIGTGEDYSCTDCSLTRSMVTINASTMAVLQHHQEPSPNADQDFGTSPVFFHDSQNRTLVAAGHKNGTFYAYDISTLNGGSIWTRGGGTTVGLMPAYDPSFGTGGTLFIVTGSITAVDPANGNVRWGPVSIPSSHGNIAIANGLIFVNGGAGGLQIRSETDGSLLRTLPPANAGAANSGVAVSHGFIYWISGSYINAWSLPAGTPVPTNTPGPNTATRTPTSTAPPATATGTSVPPSSTNTPTNTPTPTVANTPLPTQTPGGLTATPVPSNTSTSTSTPMPPTNTPANTRTATSVAATRTPLPTQTPGGPTATSVPASSTPTPCTITFSDVPPGSTFYPYIRCLACLGIVSGYDDGTFRPNNNVTRGQLAKIVSNSAGFNDPVSGQSFQDVLPGSTFYTYTERLVSHGAMTGYPCGGPGEPCGPGNLPYFRTNNNATRGQISKIVSIAAGYTDPPGAQIFQDVPPGSTFYDFVQRLASRGIMSGYPCGGPGEPCGPGNLPYFRPNNNATRGQSSKIVSNTFFPDCNPPARR